jgi:hypothetical protein
LHGCRHELANEAKSEKEKALGEEPAASFREAGKQR